MLPHNNFAFFEKIPLGTLLQKKLGGSDFWTFKMRAYKTS